MNCPDCRQIISAHVDGEASAGELVLMEEHLVGCAACRSYRADLQEIRKALKGWPDEVPSPRPGPAVVFRPVRPGWSPRLAWGVVSALIVFSALGFLAGRASSVPRMEVPPTAVPSGEIQRTVYPEKNEIHTITDLQGMDVSHVRLR